MNRDRGNAKRRDPDRESARLVLASASPRRREILREAGLLFDVLPAALDETPLPAESPAALVERLAREKALDVARRLPGSPARLVLGSDTIVVAPDDRILGKPRDAEHAVEQLARIVGRWHQVMTAIAVARSGGEAGGSGDAGTRSRIVVTRVEMRPATREELAEYVALGESFDKAGGYALQGGGSRFVLSVEGSRSNVIGLPLEETLALLEEARRDWLESSVSLLPETG
ncbi:MAG: Maf family protein [bacterium]